MSKREDIFEKLNNLIEQNQFELVSDKVDDNRLKVIYLMNDAVESFIVFENARITGEYIKDYQGEINTSLTVQKNDSTGNDEYVLVVHQKDSVCTVFFEDVSFEVNLYNYGRTAHFWIEGYEYLRQLEYKISILRDKLDYLGEKYCNDLEKELANLTDFPPLNYCFYPSVPEKYLVPRDNPCEPTDKAITVMLKVAREQQDKMLYQVLVLYKQFKNRKLAKVIATMLHRKSHRKVVESLMEKMNINITTEYIKLDQLLKFSALAESGAMAKDMIFDGIVSVNGEVCTMRGKKIRPGDKVTVEFEDATVEVEVGAE